jgi:hypothetical protein
VLCPVTYSNNRTKGFSLCRGREIGAFRRLGDAAEALCVR